MSGNLLKRKSGFDHYATGIKAIYPSSRGGDTTYSYANTDGERIPAEDAEPRAIKCFHCGFPIEDAADVETCPICGSDNLYGRDYS